MSITDPNLAAVQTLEERLTLLWERTGDAALHRLAAGKLPVEAEAVAAVAVGGGVAAELDPEHREQVRRDWISTALMRCFKDTTDTQAFGLLFELNRQPFLHAIEARIRRCGVGVDAHDVLQEVFLNIYRYPHRFQAEKSDSFRNWGHRIVQNTLLKFIKTNGRLARFASLDDEVFDRADPRVRTPYRTALEAEGAVVVDYAYLIYLNLYLQHFERLSEKERRALTYVEVDGDSYKEATAKLGIRLENLKMVIFRGRRKIFRGMHRTLEELNACLLAPRAH